MPTEPPRVHELAADVVAFTANVFLVEGDRTTLVDAGANFDVVTAVERHVDALDAVVCTHTHEDHVGNVDDLRDAFDVETWGFDADHPAIDTPLRDGEPVRIGDGEYETLHTPGHKPDHCCFYNAAVGVCFAGDLVFANGGFGRTDLPGGDRGALVESIDRLLDAVDDDLTALYVGHGPSVTDDPLTDVRLAARMARSA